MAWTLGMLPSTVMSLGAGSGASGATAEPGRAVVLGLAFLMGLVAGTVVDATNGLALVWLLRRKRA